MGFRTIPPVELLLPQDETEIFSVAFARQSVPFALGLTDRAVYFPAINRWSIREPWRIRRVPREQIQRVAVRRTKPALIWAGAVSMIVVGLLVTFVMLLPFREGGQGTISVWPFVIIIAGAVLPFTTRGRRTLHIQFVTGEQYQWKPPFYAADMTRDHIAYLMEQIVKGFRRLRIYVHEEQ
jgi:hypothetical protein